MNRVSKGFTLIELMVVVAIIGILVAIALPAYSDFAKKGKMSEVLMAASACRTSITETIQTASTLPDADAWGCEVASGAGTKYVKDVHTDAAGKISVTATGTGDTSIDGAVVTVKPFADVAMTKAPAAGGTVAVWRCGDSADGTSASIKKFLPSSCKG